MFKKWLSALICTASLWHASVQATEYAIDRPEVKAFIQEMSDKHGFSKRELTSWFRGTVINPEIIKTMTKPAETLPWHRYEKIFLTEKNIENGVQFWKDNEQTLRRAEKTYGVPAEVIVAIIGVETRYGENKGKYPVLDSLSTLAFAYPPRAKFFRSELEHFLLLTREHNMDPTQIKGSYAGAMGMPQFISSSYRNFAVDFAGNGRSDLINNPEDAIGSVANYFSKHGWEMGKPVITQAMISKPKNLNKVEQSPKNPKPNYTLGELNQLGVKPKNLNSRSHDERFALLTFEEANGPSYWLGLNNFYVITRYNHSHHYAMAVNLLANKVKEQKQEYDRS